MFIREIKQQDKEEWLRMRQELWPECTEQRHAEEMQAMMNNKSIINELSWVVLVVGRPDGKLGGFIETSIKPHDDDCESEPVGHIEGWYIDQDLRNKGLGKRLMNDAEKWVVTKGCKEIVCEAQLDNEISIKSYKALGYIEIFREAEVKFKKVLIPY